MCLSSIWKLVKKTPEKEHKLGKKVSVKLISVKDKPEKGTKTRQRWKYARLPYTCCVFLRMLSRFFAFFHLCLVLIFSHAFLNWNRVSKTFSPSYIGSEGLHTGIQAVWPLLKGKRSLDTPGSNEEISHARKLSENVAGCYQTYCTAFHRERQCKKSEPHYGIKDRATWNSEGCKCFNL